MLTVHGIKQMSRDQLIELAGKMNVRVHHKAKDDTLRDRIMQEWGSKQMAPQPKHEEQTPPAQVAITNTKEDVLNAIAKFSQNDAFKAEFPDDGTVVFSKNGYSESVNMSVPLRVIVRQAESVNRTKYFFRKAKNTDGNDVLMV